MTFWCFQPQFWKTIVKLKINLIKFVVLQKKNLYSGPKILDLGNLGSDFNPNWSGEFKLIHLLPQVVQKIWRNSLLILVIFIIFPQFFLIFWHYLVIKKLMTSLITEDVRDFSFSNYFKYIVQQLYKTILILDKFFLKYEGNVGGRG